MKTKKTKKIERCQEQLKRDSMKRNDWRDMIKMVLIFMLIAYRHRSQPSGE